MKKYNNTAKFIRGHAITVQLAAVAIGGLGVAIFCSAYTLPEGCTGSVTLNASVDSSCGSATVSVDCTGDDSSDSVTVSDNGGPGTSVPFLSEDYMICDHTVWDVAVPNAPITVSLVTGLNKLVANSGELGDSPAVNITKDSSGCAWKRTEFYHTPTGRRCPVGGLTDEIDWNVACYCLPKKSYAYKETETTDESPSDCYHLPNLDNGVGATTDSNYKYSATDYWRIVCDHTTCYHSCNLTRHIYEPLIGTPDGDVATETVGVTVFWSSSSTHLEGGGSSYTWQ